MSERGTTTSMSSLSMERRTDGNAPSWNWQSLGIGPVDLEETLDGGQAFRWHELDAATYEGVIGREVVRFRNDGGDISVATRGLGDGASLEAGRDYMASGQDPAVMFDVFADEPWATDTARARTPLRVLRQDPWECLAAFVCSQNANMVRIKQLVASLAKFGDPLDNRTRLYAFPNPEVIAGIEVDVLRELRFGYRAPYLVQTARIVDENGPWLWSLRDATYDDAKRELLELPGVGPKVADCVLAYSLDKGESFPIDVHVMRAMQRLYDLPEGIKLHDVAEFARDRFGEWSALVQLYVFRDEVNRRKHGSD